VVTSSQELQHILPPFFSARKAEAEEAAAAASAALSTGAAPIKQEQELEAIDPEF
jgi:malic enzyme